MLFLFFSFIKDIRVRTRVFPPCDFLLQVLLNRGGMCHIQNVVDLAKQKNIFLKAFVIEECVPCEML